MKRVIKLTVTILYLLLSCGPFLVFAKDECESRDINLSSNAYKVLNTCEYKDYDACINVYKHIKSGAHVVHWKNKDIDRGFGVAYKTLPENNNGVNHILEHCICAGSPKYNDTNLFFNVLGKTSHTYLNAVTGQDFTMYVASSLFENQLLKFVDMFMSCTLDPVFLQDKRVFYREACRFELEDRKAPININGTVFNEMTNCYTKGNRYEYLELMNSIIKGHNYYDAGGNPEFIPDVKFEHVVETWKEYYHPSNSAIFLYGDIDVNMFLDFLDKNFLSHYDKKDIKQNENRLEVCDGPINKEIYYPSSQENINRDICDIFTLYYREIDKKNIKTSDYIYLAEAFDHSDSPFKRILREEMPDVSSHVMCERIGDYVILIFNADDINKDDKQKFNDIVSRAIDEVITKGFCNTVIDSFRVDIPSRECQRIIDKENKKSDIGISFIYKAASLWASKNNWKWVNKLDLDVVFNTDKLPVLMKSFSKKPKNFGTVIAVPKSEIIKKKDMERNNKLKEIKKSMDDNQLDELINFTSSMSDWSRQKGNPRSYKYISDVNLSDLNFKIDVKSADEKYIDDIRAISVNNYNNLNEVSFTSIIFGMRGLSKEERRLADVGLTISFANKTHLHSFSEISNLISHNFSAFGTQVGGQRKKGEMFSSSEIYWTGLSEKFDTMFDIVKEVLTDTDFSDTDNITAYISRIQKRMMTVVSNRAVDIMKNRGVRSLKNRQTNSAFGNLFETYKFLCKLQREIKENPDATVNKIKSSLFKLLCSEDVIICTICNKEYSEKFEKSLCEFIHSTRERYKENKSNIVENKEEDYKEKFGKKEAFILEDGGQYNGLVAICPEFEKHKAGFKVLEKIILNEYLLNKVRDELGAYSCSINFTYQYMKIISGSDPNINKTFEAFKGIPDWLDKFKISQEMLDEYKVKVYTDIIKNYKNTANDQIYDRVYERDPNDIKNLVNNIRNLKLEDITKLYTIFREMMSSPYLFSIGNCDKINKEIDNFDNIICFSSDV